MHGALPKMFSFSNAQLLQNENILFQWFYCCVETSINQFKFTGCFQVFFFLFLNVGGDEFLIMLAPTNTPCMALYCMGVMCSKPGGGTSQYL